MDGLCLNCQAEFSCAPCTVFTAAGVLQACHVCVCAQAGADSPGHRQHRVSDVTMHHLGHGCGSVS